MSSTEKKGKVESFSVRGYMQNDGRYLAICSVDRVQPQPVEGQPPVRHEAERYTGSSETTLGAALASVLQLSGVLEP